jgi:hypothetical protein
MVGFQSFRFRPVRILTVVAGACAIAWAGYVLPALDTEASLRDDAQQVLAGAQYTNEQADQLRVVLKAAATSDLSPSSLRDIAVIRLALAEFGLQSGDRQQTDRSLCDLSTALSAALADNPTASFLWLADYWLKSTRDANGSAGLESLRMSYRLGPNESWIALRRSPLALGAYSKLPDDLAESALSEFAAFVRSGFYADAADILAGPAWAVHQKLLNGLYRVDLTDRQRFARALEPKDLDGVYVPGVD